MGLVSGVLQTVFDKEVRSWGHFGSSASAQTGGFDPERTSCYRPTAARQHTERGRTVKGLPDPPVIFRSSVKGAGL